MVFEWILKSRKDRTNAESIVAISPKKPFSSVMRYIVLLRHLWRNCINANIKHGTPGAQYPDVYTDTFIFFLRSLCKIIWINVHYFPNAPRNWCVFIFFGCSNQPMNKTSTVILSYRWKKISEPECTFNREGEGVLFKEQKFIKTKMSMEHDFDVTKYFFLSFEQCYIMNIWHLENIWYNV